MSIQGFLQPCLAYPGSELNPTKCPVDKDVFNENEFSH